MKENKLSELYLELKRQDEAGAPPFSKVYPGAVARSRPAPKRLRSSLLAVGILSSCSTGLQPLVLLFHSRFLFLLGERWKGIPILGCLAVSYPDSPGIHQRESRQVAFYRIFVKSEPLFQRWGPNSHQPWSRNRDECFETLFSS